MVSSKLPSRSQLSNLKNHDSELSKFLGKRIGLTKKTLGIHHHHKDPNEYVKKSPFLKDHNLTPLEIDKLKLSQANLTPQEMQHLQERINRMAVSGIMATEMGLGAYQMQQAKVNPIDIIARNLKIKPDELILKTGTTDALHKAYKQGIKTFGISSIFAGLGALIRFSTGIADTYQDVQHTKLRTELNTEREKLIVQLSDRFRDADYTHHKTEEDLKVLSGQIIKKFDHFNQKEKQSLEKVTNRRVITSDINVASNLVTSISSLISAKGMATAAMNTEAIKQAIKAFTKASTASTASVMATKVGMGLFAAGITTSALMSIAGVVDHFVKRARHNTKKPNQKPKQETAEQINNRMIRMNLASGAGQLMNGLGDIMLLTHNPGFKVNALYSWGSVIAGNRPLLSLESFGSWLGASFMLMSGVGSLVGAGIKMNENRKLAKMTPEEKEKARLEKQKQLDTTFNNNANMAGMNQMMMM